MVIKMEQERKSGSKKKKRSRAEKKMKKASHCSEFASLFFRFSLSLPDFGFHDAGSQHADVFFELQQRQARCCASASSKCRSETISTNVDNRLSGDRRRRRRPLFASEARARLLRKGHGRHRACVQGGKQDAREARRECGCVEEEREAK